MLVIPQSVVLYSRFHLISSKPKHTTYVRYMIIFTTIFISIPTMALGIAAQASRIPHIVAANLIWDRVQVTIFFLQETIISVLYIVETRRVLLNRSVLGQDDKTIRTVMHHLIYINMLVLFLDCSLLAMSYSPYFYVQAAFKPCVYGVKLRVEFSVLNRLVSTLQGSLAYFRSDSSELTPRLRAWESSTRRSVRMENHAQEGDPDMLRSTMQYSAMSSVGDVSAVDRNGTQSENSGTKVSKPHFLLRKPDKIK
jgi:hypothetical protein